VGAKVAASVKSVARSAALDHEDLLSEAIVGLCESALTYDPNRGKPFSGFAQRRVRGAPMDAVRAATPYGRKSWDEACAVETQVETHAQATGRLASRSELASALGVEQADIERARITWQRSRTARVTPDAGDGDTPLLEMADIEAPGDDTHVTAIVVDQAVTELEPSDQKLIIERYLNDRTQASLAQDLGVSEARVCQKEGAARTQLRALLSDGSSSSMTSPEDGAWSKAG